MCVCAEITRDLIAVVLVPQLMAFTRRTRAWLPMTRTALQAAFVFALAKFKSMVRSWISHASTISVATVGNGCPMAKNSAGLTGETAASTNFVTSIPDPISFIPGLTWYPPETESLYPLVTNVPGPK